MTLKGFTHPGYAGALAEFGTPRALPRCGGWILERPINGSSYRDAMGCYPLFVCRDWSQLHDDLSAIKDDLVSLGLVSDPFGQYDEALLHHCFDKVLPFKEHFVADLSLPITSIVSAHHRKYARKALKSLTVEICEEPARFADEWTALYGELTRRFNITGIRAFSAESFRQQLSIPGAVLLRALHQGKAVAAHLVLTHDDVCYGHLVGSSQAGQDLLASYALYWTELEYFSDKLRWFDWGAGAGVSSAANGLTQFKQGWSTGTKTTWFCGKIFNQEKYDEMTKQTGVPATDYFPAYRMGEFV